MLYDYLPQHLAATNDFPALRRCIADVRRMLEKVQRGPWCRGLGRKTLP